MYYGELENRELFVSLLNVMHFEIRTDRNTVCTDRYSASILDNPPVGGGHSRKEWLELCRRGLKTPTPRQTKIAHFATQFKTEDITF